MEILSNPFSSILIVSSLLVGILSIYIAIKLGDSTRWIALTMLLVCIWGFFYGLELSETRLENILFWIDYEYIGISYVPAAWLVFTLNYSGFNRWQAPHILIGIFLIPTLTFLAVLTNDLHHLHYAHTEVKQSGSLAILQIQVGPWYYIHTAYSYLAYLVGTLILWKRFKSADPIYRIQTKLMIISGFLPLIFNVLYQVGLIKPFDGIDLTPFAFLLTYTLLGFAIVRYSLFSLKPIAQTKIMESLSKGVLVVDARHQIVDFNPAFRKFYGKEKSISIGLSSKDLLVNTPEVLDLLEQVKESNQTISLVNRQNQKTYQVESIPLFENKTTYYGEILLFDDQTEQIKTNERLREQTKELQQLNDLKDKFFSIISHDLKGPVFGVKELIHMTQTGLITQEEFMEMLPEVSKNMEQVAILLENLLAWSSSQIRGEQIHLDNFDIAILMHQQRKLLQRIAVEKEVEIQIADYPPTWVLADRNMMDMVLRNLINNAIKFSKAGGTVQISVKDLGQSIQVCVKDNGIGINQENLQKIQEGVSFTTRGQNNESGTGLGLILVKEYIHKNKGKLWIESEVGHGSKFCIQLPKGTPTKN